MEQQYFLGVDIGTTAIKAALFDGCGQKLLHRTQEYELLKPSAQRVEQACLLYTSIIDVVAGHLEHTDSGVHAELNGPFHELQGIGPLFVVHGSHGEAALAAETSAVDLYAAVPGGLTEAASPVSYTHLTITK